MNKKALRIIAIALMILAVPFFFYKQIAGWEGGPVTGYFLWEFSLRIFAIPFLIAGIILMTVTFIRD